MPTTATTPGRANRAGVELLAAVIGTDLPPHWVAVAPANVLRDDLRRAARRIDCAEVDDTTAAALSRLRHLANGHDPRGGTLRVQVLTALGEPVQLLTAAACRLAASA